MRKILVIGWKDLRLAFRDRAGLILMLAAPFVLTLAMGFVTGRFSGSPSGLAEIPLVVVNQDDGPLGQALVDVFYATDLSELLAPATLDDPEAARRQAAEDEVAAAVIIPAGFSASIIPAAGSGPAGPAVAVEVVANPARPVSAGVVGTIVESFASQVETSRVGAEVVVAQLLASGRLSPPEAQAAGTALGLHLGAAAVKAPLITLQRTEAAAEAAELDVLAFFAPAMAMMFLMYTVSQGGRSLLAERDQGTLARLLTTPTASAQVLGGKVLGIFLTGAAQVGILVAGTSLLFGLAWGDPLAVALLVLAVSAAATGWGLLLAAFARSPAQVGSVGVALMLLFSMLSGTFIPLFTFPVWLRLLGRATPNAWGLEAFTVLGSGGRLAEIAGPLAALAVMAAVLFAAAVWLFGRNHTLTQRG